ncbi:nucleoside/nucleotide kinase family protein [Oribacterium sp. C9]|uniref:nucleoside/nucleotide kinase family protein n=1 Tax=Oribacterium sp. C9 TaxID=1943579 RepID=UPI0009CCE522|nr:nucleoside/nucleotide kinase family protein [Oribacterium sp. C9]OON84974.1 nucleoside/nucleotide kinase family protein [Oribacterium sp. C9]
MINYSVEINGINVEATYSDKSVEELFLPLLKHLTVIQKEKGRRILVMLAAPPGAGKSTLCSFLESLSKEHDDICDVQAIGMDGFHRRQEYLVSHTALRDGKEIKMVDIKGAPVTFDLEKLTEAVRKVVSGVECYWPSYDRHFHNPVEDAVHITGDIVLLEGNYLLLDEEGWSDLRRMADYTISISASEDLLRSRLIDRKIKSGNDMYKASKFVDFSDMANVRLCLEKTTKADLLLRVSEDGEYERS